MKSKKARKQRKRLFNAPLHKKRKWLASHLAENLLLKYDHRSTTIVKDDTVKVMRGSFKGHEDKVARVDIRKQIVEIEGITTTKADGTKIAKPMQASNLLLTKLNLTDNWRRKKLERGLSEETKKEIEKEAEEQIKELEEEKLADEIAKSEELEDSEKIGEETIKIPEKEEGKAKEETKMEKKVEKKQEIKKKTVAKKDKPAQSKNVKKTTTKTTKKKEGNK